MLEKPYQVRCKIMSKSWVKCDVPRLSGILAALSRLAYTKQVVPSDSMSNILQGSYS